MIPGLQFIISRKFTVDDCELNVSLYYNPDDAASLRVVYDVSTRKTKAISNNVLQIYRGTNWFRAYDAIYEWHERRFKEKLDRVMNSVNAIDNHAVSVIKEARE